ncbi:POTRA domain-containing protein [Nonlabens sp. Hel1_33_55]|uniref:POTRA domain-containing protein n=1 Tax=Nonlabens sp. Hel1_33_55 TaxID=1336802 RepID=UPI0012FD60C5|nr:POTRA domain-containing protein [Nonlabens sp. Hel1_33_55]
MDKRFCLTWIFFMIMICAFSQNITSVEFKGLKRTRSSFLERILKAQVNAAADSSIIALDVERLNRLPGIAKATVSQTKKNNGDINVTYTIDENFTIIPGLRVSTAANGDFAFRISLFEFNALGANHLIGGYYQNEVFSSYGAFIESRYLFSNKAGLGVNFQNNNTFEPIYFDNQTETNYRYLNQLFESYLMYEFDFRNRAELGFSIASDDYTYEDGELNTSIPSELDADRINFRTQYEYINLDIDYQYVSGWRSQTDIQVLTGGNQILADNLIINNDLEYLTRVGTKGNWASRLRLGYASNNDSPFAPFIVDNQVNIRGGGNVVARGTATATINTEYRHTLYEKGWFVLQGNSFLDLNTQRQVNERFDSSFNSDNIRVSPGLGVRFIHKRIFNAVFRLDYGIGIGADASNGLVFGIGQYF